VCWAERGTRGHGGEGRRGDRGQEARKDEGRVAESGGRGWGKKRGGREGRRGGFFTSIFLFFFKLSYFDSTILSPLFFFPLHSFFDFFILFFFHLSWLCPISVYPLVSSFSYLFIILDSLSLFCSHCLNFSFLFPLSISPLLFFLLPFPFPSSSFLYLLGFSSFFILRVSLICFVSLLSFSLSEGGRSGAALAAVERERAGPTGGRSAERRRSVRGRGGRQGRPAADEDGAGGAAGERGAAGAAGRRWKETKGARKGGGRGGRRGQGERRGREGKG